MRYIPLLRPNGYQNLLQTVDSRSFFWYNGIVTIW
jgi:hypothetical protein